MPDTYRPSPGDSDSLLDELASYGSRTPSPQPREDDPVALQDYIHKLTKGELEAPVHQVMDTKKLYGGGFFLCHSCPICDPQSCGPETVKCEETDKGER